MLIVEGTDLLGKTTLAQRLTKELAATGMPYQYVHSTRLPNSHDRCHHYVQAIRRCIVQDRFMMSEAAYVIARQNSGVAEQHSNQLTREMARWVNGHLALVGGFTVVLIADNVVMNTRIAEIKREEMYNSQIIRQANDAYGWLTVNWPEFFDCVIELTPAKPFPDDKDVEKIIADYLYRQGTISHIQGLLLGASVY